MKNIQKAVYHAKQIIIVQAMIKKLHVRHIVLLLCIQQAFLIAFVLLDITSCRILNVQCVRQTFTVRVITCGWHALKIVCQRLKVFMKKIVRAKADMQK